MVKSKINFRTQGYRLLFYTIGIIVFSINFYFIITESPVGIVSYVDVYWKWFIFVCIDVLFLILIIRTSVGVIVDLEKVTIRNYLTRSATDYFFIDIHDYVQYVDPSDKTGDQDIYLLKERRVFGRIKAEYYSNISELMSAIDLGIERHCANRSNA